MNARQQCSVNDGVPEDGDEARSMQASVVERLKKYAVVAGAVAVLPVAFASSAQANQPMGGPYAPVSTDGGQTLEAWAEMTGECPTVRCDTYIQIQRLSPGFFGLGQHWEYVTGEWVSRQEGWVSVNTSLTDGDCGTYRTLVEDYVLTPNPDGSVSAGNGRVNVEMGLDGGEDYELYTYPSSESTVCGQRYVPADVTF